MFSPDFNARIAYEIEQIRSNSAHLRSLAKAFHATGNSDVFKKLTRIAGYLDESATTLEKAYNEEFGRQFRQIDANSVNLVKAAIAGATASLEPEDTDNCIETEQAWLEAEDRREDLS